jgi:hypothetical protein
MTAHLPLRCESRSTFAPSSSSPCGSTSKSLIRKNSIKLTNLQRVTSNPLTSITFDTKYGSVLLSLIFSLFSLIFSFCDWCSCEMRMISDLSILISFSNSLVRDTTSSVDSFRMSSLISSYRCAKRERRKTRFTWVIFSEESIFLFENITSLCVVSFIVIFKNEVYLWIILINIGDRVYQC